ncbi:MAG: recombinase, partial [Alphaproteobacteria bacterium]|nr:recombinase [Alphaproteobacteria bacterium]
GKPYRNINIPQLANSINEKDCMVEIEFISGGIEYKIRRGLAPKIFEVYKGGKMMDQDAKSKDYQKMLEETILKMNYKSFCQVVILGSTNYVPFMRLPAADRRGIVENLLDINVFSVMNTLLKAKMAQVKTDISDLEHKIELQKEKTIAQKRHIETLASKNKETIDRYQKDIEESEKHTDELQKEIDEKKKKMEELINLSSQINVDKDIEKLTELARNIQSEMKKADKDISFYSTNDHCPSCSQKIDCEHKEKVLLDRNTRKSELQKGFELQQKQMEKLNEKVSEKSALSNKILLEQRMVHEIEGQISASNKYIKKLRSDIDSIQSDTKNIDEEQNKLKEMGQVGKELVENKLKLNDDMHHYSLASFLMKDTGIKSKIIKYYLPIMNKIINKYLAQMDFFVQFELSESFEETIKSRHRDIFTYDSFSEGEKRKIDLSLLFAWRAVAQLKNSLNCNLLIFDEVLDGSLDDVATESFLSILKGLDKNTNIFVISHKSKELLQDKFQDHITFVKRNNFSKIDQ